MFQVVRTSFQSTQSEVQYTPSFNAIHCVNTYLLNVNVRKKIIFNLVEVLVTEMLIVKWSPVYPEA